MRQLVSAAMAAAILFTAGGALAKGGHPSGGGGHVVAVPIMIPGRASIYTGAPAFIPLVLSDDAKAESGVLDAGTAIAVRTARAEDAIVLVDGVNDNGVLIAPGTVMVRMSFLSSATPAPIWCSVRQMPEMHQPNTDCLGDNHGSGKLDQYWRGYLNFKTAPFSLIGLMSIRPTTPVAYRPARPEEVPTVEIGYRPCLSEADGVSIPFRFTSTLRTSGGGWTPSMNTCPFGEWLDTADRTVEMVDGLRVKVAPGSPPRYQLLDVKPAGPLAAVYTDQSLRSRTAVSPAIERLRETVGHSPLEPTAPLSLVASSTLEHGATIATVPVRHGFTGVLKNDVWSGLLIRRSVPAGHYVFGVPTRDITDPRDLGQLTWCAPQLNDGGPSPVSTVCFTSDGVTHYWYPAGSALMVTHVLHGAQFGQTVGFSVQRAPGSFPLPMTLAYVFDHWVRRDVIGGRQELMAQLGVEIRINGVMTPVDHLLIPASTSQRYCMPIMNGILSFTPVDKTGGPMAPPPPNMAKADMDAYFDRAADDRALFVVVQPPVGVGRLPLSGLLRTPVGDACIPPPMIIPAPPVIAPSGPAAP